MSISPLIPPKTAPTGIDSFPFQKPIPNLWRCSLPFFILYIYQSIHLHVRLYPQIADPKRILDDVCQRFVYPILVKQLRPYHLPVVDFQVFSTGLDITPQLDNSNAV